jgi:serine phosphatase RsbU (regulator of sigma subunit)
MNDEMEEFGSDRLARVIPTARGQSAGDVVAAVVAAVDTHSRDVARWDDLTLLVVKRDGTGSENQTTGYAPEA